MNCRCSLFAASEDELAMRKQSKNIDKMLYKDKNSQKLSHRLLLLGTGESGKSTFIKQIRIIHINGFSIEEKNQYAHKIRINLHDSVKMLSCQLSLFDPPKELENKNNLRYIEYINQFDPQNLKDWSNKASIKEYQEAIDSILKDAAIKETYRRIDEFIFLESEKYFIEECMRICQIDYFPTNQDIIRCRVLTSGVIETKFSIDGVHFLIFDVGGQKSERKRWIQCFSDVTAIIFVVACSDYCKYTEENPDKNRLQESLELFENVWNNRWLVNVSFILFLNKQDLFEERIKSSFNPLENYFPAYKHYKGQLLNETQISDTTESEITRAKHFIRNLFMEVAIDENGNHFCYPHYTCTIDTDKINRVFEDCREIIRSINLKLYDLL